jgi:hypothetical protein
VSILFAIIAEFVWTVRGIMSRALAIKEKIVTKR